MFCPAGTRLMVHMVKGRHYTSLKLFIRMWHLRYADNYRVRGRGWCSIAAALLSTMSRAKSAVVFSGSDPAAKRARMGRSMSLAPVRERRRSAMGEYIGERPLSAACKLTSL